MAGLPASAQVLSILAALVEEHAGIRYGPDDVELFAEKVSVRALEFGFDSLLDYYYYLRYDRDGAEELERLIEALVVQETYFFRELSALESLVTIALEPVIQRRGRARVWSAACSTGEEPLTLAMVLAERGLLDRVEIVATDISRRGLERARRGRFRQRSLREQGIPLAARFVRQDGEELVVDEQLLTSVKFFRLNLRDAQAVTAMGRFDLILCRNVLIYFGDHLIPTIVGQLTQALEPGGCLLVGVAESLLRFSTELVCEEQRSTFFYRRPE